LVDILIKGGDIVTMNKEKKIIRDGFVAIEKDKIIDVGENEGCRDYRADKVLDARGKAVLPGLINTHVHLYQNFLKGMPDDLPLVDWCDKVLYPFCRAQHPDVAYFSNLLGNIELIKSGSTCVLNNDRIDLKIPKAAEDAGIRCIYAPTLADKWVPGDLIKPEKEVEILINKIFERWNKKESRIRCMLGPSAPFCCSEELLEKVAKWSTKFNSGIHMHIAETKYEVEFSEKNFKSGPLEYVDNLGLLDVGNFIAVHCVWLSRREINLAKKKNVKIVHCPKSNMKLGSGVAPIPEMLRKGITVGLATDGAASNDLLDMFEEMRAAALVHKVSKLDPSVISSYQVLEMATIGGAKAVGMEDLIGSIEVGKKADIIIVDLFKPHIEPVHDLVNNLIYCAKGSDVETSIIDGEVVLEKGQLKKIDEEEVLTRAMDISAEIARQDKAE